MGVGEAAAHAAQSAAPTKEAEIMTDVHIVGAAMTPLGKFPDKSVKDLAREAVGAALADAGATMADVEAGWFSNTRQGMMEGQNTIRGQCALRSMGFQSIPIVNVEHACCRSEERRVGKECVSTCLHRCSPFHLYTHKQIVHYTYTVMLV